LVSLTDVGEIGPYYISVTAASIWYNFWCLVGTKYILILATLIV